MSGEQNFKYEARTSVLPPEFVTHTGFVTSTDTRAALEEVIKSFAQPSRVFSAEIRTPTSEQPLARFLSARAATQEAAPRGMTQWREDGLYVDGKKVPERQEVYELVK